MTQAEVDSLKKGDLVHWSRPPRHNTGTVQKSIKIGVFILWDDSVDGQSIRFNRWNLLKDEYRLGPHPKRNVPAAQGTKSMGTSNTNFGDYYWIDHPVSGPMVVRILGEIAYSTFGIANPWKVTWHDNAKDKATFSTMFPKNNESFVTPTTKVDRP